MAFQDVVLAIGCVRGVGWVIGFILRHLLLLVRTGHKRGENIKGEEEEKRKKKKKKRRRSKGRRIIITRRRFAGVKRAKARAGMERGVGRRFEATPRWNGRPTNVRGPEGRRGRGRVEKRWRDK